MASLFAYFTLFVPMSLNLEQVRRVAQLARLEISEAEAEQTLSQLNRIFTLIEEMQAVDTRGIEPMAHAQDLAQRRVALGGGEAGDLRQHVVVDLPAAGGGIRLLSRCCAARKSAGVRPLLHPGR